MSSAVGVQVERVCHGCLEVYQGAAPFIRKQRHHVVVFSCVNSRLKTGLPFARSSTTAPRRRWLRDRFAVTVRKVVMPQKLADYIAYSWRHLDRSYQLWVESFERFRFDGEKGRAKLPSNPGSLRAQAVRLFAMAIQVRENEYADKLIAQAVELQDQATAMEQAAKVPSNERPPAPSTMAFHQGYTANVAKQERLAERSAPLAIGQSTLPGRPILPVSRDEPRARRDGCEGIVEQQRLETT